MPEEAKQIVAIDVAATATAVEAESALNAVCDSGYYVLNISPLQNGGVRAFFGKRREPKPPRGTLTEEEDTKARQYLEDHDAMKDRDLAKAFRDETGIDRSYKWFQRKRKGKA